MPPFHFNHYSGILLIFFIHGLVYGILLWRRGVIHDSPSDKWLSFFLLLCVLYICPWMLGFAGWYEGSLCINCRNFLFYAPLQQTLLMGPVIFFYLRSLFYPDYKLSKKDYLHFLPPLLYLIWSIIVFVTDIIVLDEYYLMDGIQDPDFDSWYLLVGLISLLVYLGLSIKLYREYKVFIVGEYSFADTVTYKWVRNFLYAFLTYFLLNLGFHIAGIWIDFRYIDSWWYYVFFGVIFYYIALQGYTVSLAGPGRRETVSGADKTEGPSLPSQLEEEVAEALAPEEEGRVISEEWKARVLNKVVAEKLYQNPQLTLTELSRHLDAHPVLISRVINTGFEMNFNDFINKLRVEEVMAQLKKKEGRNYTIMSLAYDAGFNSKATFNRAFKKFTGKNPKDFLE